MHSKLRFLPFVLLLFICAVSLAQVTITNASFDKALKQARKEKKLLMVVIDSKTCEQCNAVATKGLSSEAAYALNSMVVAIRPAAGTDEWQHMVDAYFRPVNQQFGVLFFNRDGDLVHRYNGSTSAPDGYLQEASRAMKQQQSPLATPEQLQQKWESNPSDTASLRQLILLKKSYQQEAQSLVDTYAKSIPADSFHVPAHITAVISLAPVLGSYADSVARRTDTAQFRKAWYQMDLPTRSRINMQIILASRQQAIRTKDYGLASRTARFAAAIQTNASSNEQQGIFLRDMASYYKAVHDTGIYITYARYYVNNYLNKISPDSIKRLDKQAEALILQQIPPIKSIQGNVYTATRSFKPRDQDFANQYNIYAWDVYTMSKKPQDLATAMEWAERGLAFREVPTLLDTYARLLYTTGNKEKAIEMMEKAVATMQQSSLPAEAFEKVLASMKNGSFVPGS
jgi:hypothetical protein